MEFVPNYIIAAVTLNCVRGRPKKKSRKISFSILILSFYYRHNIKAKCLKYILIKLGLEIKENVKPNQIYMAVVIQARISD